jgi:TnpA family transposase
MPTRFLTTAQRARFARLPQSPSEDDLVKAFTLDEADLRDIRNLRTAKNRLGYAALLTGARYVGAFPTSQHDVPSIIATYLRTQLSIDAQVSLEAYFSAPKTVERHIRTIRERHGFVYYADTPKLRMRLTRWLYLECWMGNDRPATLVLQAADWLVAHNVLLPGLSILERFVGRIRDRATTRLWARIVSGLSEAQRDQIASLLAQDASRLNSLGVLRASPLKRRQSDLWVHLDRLDAVRDLNMNLTPSKGVPVIQLERLARVARHSKPSAIAALKEPRRTATVAALLFTLEATAQDEVTELGDALIADLFRDAELAQAAGRQAHQQAVNEAIVLLRDLAEFVRDDANDNQPHGVWRRMVHSRIPEQSIEHAIMSVDTLAKPSVGKPYAELASNWRRARKLFSSITSRIDMAASPGGADVAAAMAWLRDQPDWSKMKLENAPCQVISKAWEPHVCNADGEPENARAYVFATIDAWRNALKRRDLYASPGIRYADPRIGMLEGTAWQGAKGVVCRSLNRSLDGAAEVHHLARTLDATFKRVASRADQNPDLHFETDQGKRRIALARLDRMAEPDSLIKLRSDIRSRMPKAAIPDLLLEVMRRTKFAEAFTHLSERPAHVENFQTSLCAALVAQGCNIGFEPITRNDHPALRRSRLSWVSQNFIRPETLATANARIVSAHAELPIAQFWGDGQTASADGLRFIVPKTAIHAGPNARYFGKGRGITWYNMLSDQYSGLGAMVVPGTLRDSLAILALLLEQETELDPTHIMTDTAAYSDAIFGLFWLLGYQFCPRLADIGGARIWRVDREANYGPLGDIAEGKINTRIIIENWTDLIRLAGSLKLGHLKAESVMRILQVRDRPTTLAKALVQLGRLIKTLHILNYVDDTEFRRRILIQLNRQEFRHKLARKIYHGDRGEVRNALRQGQEEQLGALGLILNAVTHWNAVYIQEAIAQIEAQGARVDLTDIARISPVLWQHINFLGRYDITLPESVAQGGLRPLRDPTSEWDF